MPRKKKETLPIKLVTLDTETFGLGGGLKRIAIYAGQEVIYGYKFADVEPYLEQWFNDGFNVHVYIHNIEFDARKLDGLFERGKIQWGRTKIINQKYAVISTLCYTLHDSFKILPKSLDSISKSFKVDHAKLDLWEQVEKRYPGEYKDKVDFFINCNRDDPLYMEYLGYDVISLYEVIEKLIDVSGIPLDDFIKRISTASISRYVMKNGYKGHIFQHPDNNKTDYEMLTSFKGWGSKKLVHGKSVSYLEIENKIRQGYCGGRTEVFVPSCGYCYHYDVNSLYPSVMAMLRHIGKSQIAVGLQFPVGFPELDETPTGAAGRFEHWMNVHRGLGFIRCRVYVPMQTIPPLPCKMGKLAFVCGHIAGMWSYTELEYAVKECGVEIEEYIESIYFRDTFPIFENFIGLLAAIKSSEKAKPKEEQNAALIEFTKLLQNTAYGWTVLSRDDKTELLDICKREKFIENGRLLNENEDLGCIEVKSIVTGDSIQAPVGAYVTSYARLIWLDMARKQAEKGGVYYGDTDSLFTEYPMDAEYVSKFELGKWDLEDEIQQAIFVQPKVYCYVKADGSFEAKYKGVSRETQAGFNFAFYQKLFDAFVKEQAGIEQENILIESNREILTGLRTAQKNKVDPNILKIGHKTIHLNSPTKRSFDYAKNTSTAWYMNNIDMFADFNFRPDYEQMRLKSGDLIDCAPQKRGRKKT